ncbi:hypothetical protein JD844_011826 [Phrynosoma platyrhinos]|uniref:C-type lectin domain-containing protein n=1 Tax=Phrynosoma platyrhinos TaxID=52577 RepID=A0ABQ7TJK5_PHRPL|nr:hypothetical protein JD844_011826 [Phrynosoma platyrhinos]
MYDDTEAPNRGDGLPYRSRRPLPAKPIEKNENVEGNFTNFGRMAFIMWENNLGLTYEYESFSEESNYDRISLPSKREEPKAQAKQSNQITDAAMISELRKLNFSSTQAARDVSTALLNIKNANSAFLAELRTLENYIDQRCDASDRKVEKEIFRLEEKLSTMANRQDTEERWENARKLCAAANSHLIIINSKREQDFVVPKIKQTTVWLGLSDTKTEGTWLWVDGSLQGLKYWKHGEPNNTGDNEDCAVLYREGKWNDIPCDREVHFVCERSG